MVVALLNERQTLANYIVDPLPVHIEIGLKGVMLLEQALGSG